MSMIENLESRQLMTIVTVTDIVADNRGEATIRLSGDVTGVSKRTVRLYSAGPDEVANTNDDVLVNRYAVVYSAEQDRITIRGNITADTKYRVRMQAQQIKSTSGGEMLDGTFTGTFPTGDNVAGGNLNFFVRRNASTTPRVRFATSAGNIDVTMRGDLSGIKTTVDNFLNYVDSGRLDGTIIHRKITDASGGIAIVQGGGFYGTAEDTQGSPTQKVDADAPIPLQAGVLSNTTGTIAMARTNDPNSATSQYFFNVNDNTALDPTGAGTGYAVFGSVANSISQTNLNTIYAAPNVSVGTGGTFSTLPRIGGEDIVVRRISTLARVDTLQ